MAQSGGRIWRRSSGAVLARLALAVLAVSLAGCDKPDAYVPPPPAKVTTAQPVKQPVTLYMELTGNSSAVNSVDLMARVQGALQSVNYKDGATVKKDDVLFVIEPDPYRAQLDQAKGVINEKQAAVVQTSAEYERQAQLGKQNFASQSNVDQARAQRDQAQAGLEQAKASAQIATINLGYTQVKAPFDGVVSAHLVDPGALVGYGGPTKLATIVQLDPIYVSFNVSERQVLLIREGMARQGRTLAEINPVPIEVGLLTEEGYPHQGRLDYIAPELDSGSGTLALRGILENKGGVLLPGLFVRIRIAVQHRDDMLLVDDKAIGSDQRGPYVLVVNKDEIVEQRPVKTGQLSGELRVIEQGLTIDDWVVVGGIARAVPGNKVTPQKTAMVAGAQAEAPKPGGSAPVKP